MSSYEGRLVLFVAVFGSLSLSGGLAQQAGGAAPQEALFASMTGTAAISGVVTDVTTHQPLADVLLDFGCQGRVGTIRHLSDEKGRFVFSELAACGNYIISASKFGYLESNYGAGPNGRPVFRTIELRDGEWFSDANISLERPAAITGTIVDERGTPAVGVFVRVLAQLPIAGRTQLASSQTTKTDDRGIYRLADLVPGRYIVHVPVVQQTAPVWMTPAELAGVPMSPPGRARVVPDPSPALDVSTGNRLILGGYPVPPPPIDGVPQAYPAMFYPGVTALNSATSIELRAGEERSGVDLSLRPVAAASISGVVEGPREAFAAQLVRLVPEGLDGLGIGSEVATTALSPDGRFTLLNVPVGSYTLDIRRTISGLDYKLPTTSATALPATPGTSGLGGGSIFSGPYGTGYSNQSARGDSAYFAQVPITIDGRRVIDFAVQLQRPASIRGKFVMENGEPLKGPTLVFAEPADGNVALGVLGGRLAVMDTFDIQGLLRGQYVLRFPVIANKSVVSVIADGEDYRDKPLDFSSGRDLDVVVNLTDKKTRLWGTTVDRQGMPVKNALVLAFPVERDQWTNYGLSPARLKQTPTSSSGAYDFPDLPAGTYYVVAVSPDQDLVWQDPESLARLAPSASRVSLAWGDVKTQRVTVVKVP